MRTSPPLDDTALPVGRPRQSAVAAWLTAVRPRQWVKNLLVAAAPLAAGRLTDADVLAATGIAFVAFVVASAGTYLVNDALDAPADGLHPSKRHRPVAAGRISRAAAAWVGVVLDVVAIAIAVVASGPALGGIVAGYTALTLAYSVGLKRVPVVELGAVAGGFVLRAVAGGVAASLLISQWFLLVTSFGALFLVVGKRMAESVVLGDARGAHRSVLGQYSLPGLQVLLGTTCTLSLMTYCLWAFEVIRDGGSVLLTWSIVPMVAVMLRAAMLAVDGRAGEPEEMVRTDAVLGGAAVLLVVLLAVGVHW